MYVVLGLGGNTGTAVVETLLHAGRRVRALVRRPETRSRWAARGLELMAGDATDRVDLARAFEGAEGAYVLVPPDLKEPDPLGHYARVGEAIAAAARATGLPKLVFLSSEGAHVPDGTGPIAGLHLAEQALADAAEKTTVLRAAYFQQNWRAVWAAAEADGVLPSFLSTFESLRPMVSTDDIGRVAAGALIAKTAPALIELAGPEDYSVNDVAYAFGRALGRPVTPLYPPREAWKRILEDTGVGPAYAALLCEMYEAIHSGRVRFSGDVPLSRGRISMRETALSWSAPVPA